ncbi:2-C-methyl-D-erythritol 4-phosphate cytidylyltransferase [Kushneria aurantia]|uniref:2-C-methyl-D-erythritol 4-phosphate cytidylyltransferase n=1 Tax=Kushneria aurantia TaxID=504092 RepID=A0ABV6FZ12_9GAMM|nr:2-C-methyl-D-erythritol 4-phosphate cytidylyltransferase [Kushneria aurantia]
MSLAPWLIVPAAGRGTRMRADCPKQYLELDGRPVLTHTLARLHDAFPHGRLLLCLDPHDRWFDDAMVPFADWRRIDGGAERADSVAAAVGWLGERVGDDEPVLVHDLARPCVTVEDLRRLYAAVASNEAGALLATPVTDTLKHADGAGRVAATVPRDGLWRALTPQGFRLGVLRAAFERAREQGVAMTDEAAGVERLGLAPTLVEGRSDNLKITHPEDLALAALILRAQREAKTPLQGVSP